MQWQMLTAFDILLESVVFSEVRVPAGDCCMFYYQHFKERIL